MFLLATIFIFLFDVGTSLPVVIKTKALKFVYLKKPSILLGDFLIIPLVGGYIIDYFYSRRGALNELFSPIFLIGIGIASVALAVFSSVRFKTLSPWYYPHGIFYVFMAFLVLLFLIGKFDLTSLDWWLVFIGIWTHLLLGHFYSKKFPEIK